MSQKNHRYFVPVRRQKLLLEILNREGKILNLGTRTFILENRREEEFIRLHL